MSVAAPRNALRKQERQALSTPDAFARWVEIASISAGERQSTAPTLTPLAGLARPASRLEECRIR
jgi:hypothetical protein